ALTARCELVGDQHGLVAEPTNERQRATVPRQGGTAATTRAVGDGGDATGVAIEAADLPDAGVNVAVVRVSLWPAGEVDVAAIGGEHRFVGIAPLRLLGDGDALAAIDAVHPQLHRAERALVRQPAPRHDPLAVRRPRAGVGEAIRLAR